MGLMNRLGNAGNVHQGTTKRVLCVCSAGLLRSPTAAVVLSQPPFNFNTRAAGANPEYALIPVDDVLLSWADEIVCMEKDHYDVVMKFIEESLWIDKDKPVKVLNIPDSFQYRDEKLMNLIAERYNEI